MLASVPPRVCEVLEGRCYASLHMVWLNAQGMYGYRKITRAREQCVTLIAWLHIADLLLVTGC